MRGLTGKRDREVLRKKHWVSSGKDGELIINRGEHSLLSERRDNPLRILNCEFRIEIKRRWGCPGLLQANRPKPLR